MKPVLDLYNFKNCNISDVMVLDGSTFKATIEFDTVFIRQILILEGVDVAHGSSINGKRISTIVERMLSKSLPRVYADGVGKDRYGRILVKLYIHNDETIIDLSAFLLSNGLADFPNSRINRNDIHTERESRNISIIEEKQM